MFGQIIFAGLLGVAALGATSAAPAAAKSGDVIVSGSCTGSSDWKLKLSPEDGRIETEFEVDQNRNDRLWKVTLKRNGAAVWHGTRYTRAPSGSFTVRKLLANGAGADRIVARAKNVATDEVCRGVASF